jgi:hypothetical protein
MASFNSKALGGGGGRTATAAPGRNERRNNGSRGSSGSGKGLSARDIMHGKKTQDNTAAKAPTDPYPGLEAILKKARKMEKPFSSTDAEQRVRALREFVPLSVLRGGVVDMAERMERDYARAISNWRADNWMLPVEKETEFPYSRTRNLVSPMVKYGAAWLPRKDWDCGASYDSEGESIGFSQYMENIARAGIMETNDLRIKGVPTLPDDETDPVLLKMKNETPAIRERFLHFRFNRYEEMWNSYCIQGYTILPRFRAFKVFSKQQQKLLEAYQATPNHETKKALLAHVTAHGQLIRDCPDPDPPAPKKVEDKKKVVQKVQVGSVMDSVDA